MKLDKKDINAQDINKEEEVKEEVVKKPRKTKFNHMYPIICSAKSGEAIIQINNYEELKEFDKSLSESQIYQKMVERGIYRGHYWKQGLIENEKKLYAEVPLEKYYGNRDKGHQTDVAHYMLVNVETKKSVLYKHVDDIAHKLGLDPCDNALNKLIKEMKYYGIFPNKYTVTFIQQGVIIGEDSSKVVNSGKKPKNNYKKGKKPFKKYTKKGGNWNGKRGK